MNWPEQRRSTGRSTALLIGHLMTTTLVFVVFITLGWLVSYFSYYLNGIHKFSDETFKLIGSLELGLFYLDAAVSGIILLSGIWKFVRNILEET
jgi:hypothetical protein